MAIEDDDKPRKKITHEIGQDLSLLSVEEMVMTGGSPVRVEGCAGTLRRRATDSHALAEV